MARGLDITLCPTLEFSNGPGLRTKSVVLNLQITLEKYAQNIGKYGGTRGLLGLVTVGLYPFHPLEPSLTVHNGFICVTQRFQIRTLIHLHPYRVFGLELGGKVLLLPCCLEPVSQGIHV